MNKAASGLTMVLQNSITILINIFMKYGLLSPNMLVRIYIRNVDKSLCIIKCNLT